MADVVKFKTIGQQMDEALTKLKEERESVPESFMLQWSIDGRARYAELQKERAAAKAREKQKRQEDEKKRIKKVVQFHK